MKKKSRIVSYASRRPEGWVLAHNHVLRAVNTRHGERGFRRFWVVPDQEGWAACECGWRPDLGRHYARVPHSVAVKEEGQ